MKKYLDLLGLWGVWVRVGGINLKAQSPMLQVMQPVRPPRRGTPNITDDEALIVDSAVAALGRANGRLKDVIFMRYVNDYSLQQIALRLGVSRGAAEKKLAFAEGFVIGVLLSGAKL